jgi:hypothetical protein
LDWPVDPAAPFGGDDLADVQRALSRAASTLERLKRTDFGLDDFHLGNASDAIHRALFELRQSTAN